MKYLLTWSIPTHSYCAVVMTVAPLRTEERPLGQHAAT